MNQNDTNATTYAIGQHPSLPPPVTERGGLKWLKTNLFNTWYNSIATVIGMYLLYLVIPPTFDWVWGSATWEASSNKDCRAGPGGACWGFIKARFVLFMYGFYDTESLWRPNLAGLLLISLGIPVLVPKIPGTRVFAIFLIFLYPWLALSLLVGPIKITLFSDPTFLVLWCILILALLFAGFRGMEANDLVKRGFGFGSAYAAVVLVFLNWGLGLPEVETT